MPDKELLIRGIVQASIEMACLRHNLCLEDDPPLVVEQCAEIVEDVWNALRGIDTCAEGPSSEYTAIAAALREREPKVEYTGPSGNEIRIALACRPSHVLVVKGVGCSLVDGDTLRIFPTEPATQPLCAAFIDHNGKRYSCELPQHIGAHRAKSENTEITWPPTQPTPQPSTDWAQRAAEIITRYTPGSRGAYPPYKKAQQTLIEQRRQVILTEYGKRQPESGQ